MSKCLEGGGEVVDGMGSRDSSWTFNSPNFRVSQNIFALDIIDEITLQ